MALLSKIKSLLGNMKLFQMRWQINIHLLLWYKHRQNSDQLCEYNWHFRRFWKHVYFRIFWKHVCWFRIHILVFKTSHEDIELHLKNLVGFCSDRANIMTGKEIGVAAKFKKLLQCENMLKNALYMPLISISSCRCRIWFACYQRFWNHCNSATLESQINYYELRKRETHVVYVRSHSG